MTKATDERAMVSDDVSGPTTRQCFSLVSQSRFYDDTNDPPLVYDDRGNMTTAQYLELVRGVRKPTTNDPETVDVRQVGACYIASVGRVRVAGACPLGALALACEWAMVRRVRQVVTNVRWSYVRPCS